MAQTLSHLLAQASAALASNRPQEALGLVEPWCAGGRETSELLQIKGLALARLGRLPQALIDLKRACELLPGCADPLVNLALVELEGGLAPDALGHLDRALGLSPDLAAAHLNRGIALMKMARVQEAERSFAAAALAAPDHPDPLYNRACALERLGHYDRAGAIAQQLTSRWPALPQGWNLLGMAQQGQGRLEDALLAYRQALGIEARFVDAWLNSSSVLLALGSHAAAVHAASQAARLAPHDPKALLALCKACFEGDEQEQQSALPWLERLLQISPSDPNALSQMISYCLRTCDWDRFGRYGPKLNAMVEGGEAIIPMLFWLLTLPFSPQLLRQATQEALAKEFALLPRVAARERWAGAIGQPRPKRLRVGYFSSDFYNHATLHLMGGYFEHLDHERFESIGVCTLAKDRGPIDSQRARVMAALDRFETTAGQSDAQVCDFARAQDLHIAIDLKGLTKDARPGIFARRVAPVQIHMLGYPATQGGSSGIDYLVADRTLIEADDRAFYSEKIITLPDTYQVNDRKRTVASYTPSRAELGLAPEAFVFCCFNNCYKINPQVWQAWMAILAATPQSVLWLLATGSSAQRHLREAAASAGIDHSRLVFATTAPAPEHLARQSRADLFLDTWPYNAHTTASDALWAGLPVLTCKGSTFASRVAASLLASCDLPQLITQSAQQYVDRAKELWQDRAQLARIRAELAQKRLTAPLFDTERYVRHMEMALETAWARFASGQQPDHFSVTSQASSTEPPAAHPFLRGAMS